MSKIKINLIRNEIMDFSRHIFVKYEMTPYVQELDATQATRTLLFNELVDQDLEQYFDSIRIDTNITNIVNKECISYEDCRTLLRYIKKQYKPQLKSFLDLNFITYSIFFRGMKKLFKSMTDEERTQVQKYLRSLLEPLQD